MGVVQAPRSLGVREDRQGSGSDTGALGLAHGRCEASPGARAPSGRVVLRLKLPGPGEPSPCRAPHGRAAGAGVYSKELRGLSTRLAHGSGGPSQRPSTTPPLLPSPSTWLLSCLYAQWVEQSLYPSGKFLISVGFAASRQGTVGRTEWASARCDGMASILPIRCPYAPVWSFSGPKNRIWSRECKRSPRSQRAAP